VRQFIFGWRIGHCGIAVPAPEVATARDIPHNNRFLVGRELEEMDGKPPRKAFIAQGVGRLHITQVQFRDSDHTSSFLPVAFAKNTSDRPYEQGQPV
jgi:hypothetical protein